MKRRNPARAKRMKNDVSQSGREKPTTHSKRVKKYRKASRLRGK